MLSFYKCNVYRERDPCNYKVRLKYGYLYLKHFKISACGTNRVMQTAANFFLPTVFVDSADVMFST